jgi:hypothetical protein
MEVVDGVVVVISTRRWPVNPTFDMGVTLREARDEKITATRTRQQLLRRR